MGIFGKKNKKGNRAINVSFVDGINGYNKGTAVEVSIDTGSKTLNIKSRVLKKPEVCLNLEQIIGVNIVSEKDVIEKSKNVIGRAVVGGVLLGPLGTIIGGMSGVGNKSHSETKYYMVINYKSQNDGVKVLSFEIVGASLHWASFVEELRKNIKNE